MTGDTSAPEEKLRSLMATAIEHHNAGRLGQAGACYDEVLRANPEHVDALHLSGLIAAQSGDTERALTMIRRAIAGRPNAAMMHNNLGNILSETGQHAAALASFKRVLELDSRFVPAHYNLGNLYHQAGDLEQARLSYQATLELDAGFVPAIAGLGNVLLDLGRHQEAEQQFHAALEADPEMAAAHAGLGHVYQELRRFSEAEHAYRAAFDIDPHDARILINLGRVQRARDDADAAFASFEKALRIAPDLAQAAYSVAEMQLHRGQLEQAAAGFVRALELDPALPEAHFNLGVTCRMQGRLEQAFACFDQALRCKPDFTIARWVRAIAQIPIIHDSADEIESRRLRYRQELEQLGAQLQLGSQPQIDAAAAAVGTVQPFYLAYQGKNDCDLQRSYGELVCRIQAARYANLLPAQRTRKAASTLRIGFVSGFFYRHSNWKMPIKGWIEQLDKSRFELFGYYTGPQARMDDASDEAKRSLKKFVAQTGFEEMARAIVADELDVLIYPEIGMDPMTVRLAGLRLAPVQCASWGHPDTSGMPTIDYFLSSDLMEPPAADAHYSEKLVRLPNLSIHYTPQQYPHAAFRRTDFGLADGRVVYLCAQSLFKYLPQFDEVFAQIAKQVPGSQFAFLDYPDSPWLTDKFYQRLKRAFDAHGLRVDDFVVICRHLSQDEYHGLNLVADIFLDSIGWSGCNSTMEAIACDLPIASMAGDLMRARHTLAMLTMMGMPELVAPDRERYIDLAVRLGNDDTFRRDMAEQISANKHKLYGDRECIKGLERFLLQAAGANPEAVSDKPGFFGRLFGRA